jgi:hypothetical protein
MHPWPLQRWAFAYFVIYAFIGFLFVGNLFVGVIIDNYAEQVKMQGPGVLLTDKQRVWVDAQRHLLRDMPPKREQPPSSGWRRPLYIVTIHPLFETFSAVAIFGNVVIMMCQHYKQSEAWTDVGPSLV